MLTTFGLQVLADDGDATNGVEKGLFIGVPDGVGFKLESGSLGIAMIKPAGVGDTRSWTAVTAKITNGSFQGLGDDFQATVLSLGVEINRGTNAPALNWTTALATPVQIPGRTRSPTPRTSSPPPAASR